MQTIEINGVQYDIIDTRERITIADSFVLPSNKTGGGNGEAKLYVGQNDERLRSFFGERGFKINCFMQKTDLIDYLDKTRTEYFAPTQEYRQKENLHNLWEERKRKVNTLNDIIAFQLVDQNQLQGPRVYVNALNNDSHYKLIRELSLPNISHLNIVRLKEVNKNDIIYYIKLYSDVEEMEMEEDYEPEIENDDVIIESPFDPNKIKVRTVPSTIGQIIDDLEDKIINLDTEFQRLPNLWDETKKSRFIESLLLKMPIPAFYFNEKEENNLEVIDGLQRISTIKGFVLDKTFRLQNLEFLKEYNDATFESLPNLFSRRIKTFPITTYIIEKGTPNEVKYNIFKRVNTGGLVLTPQEIRHAINNGIPSLLVADLVRGEEVKNESGNILKPTVEGIAFIKATDDRIGSFRMEDRDFITRFVSFYLIPYQKYEPDLDTFLNKGMAKIKELSEVEILKLKDDFRNAMVLAFDVFGSDAFRKRFNINDSRKPINKALFEVLSVNFAKKSDVERGNLRTKKEIFKDKLMQLHNEPDGKFLRAITQGTALKESVIQRFTDIERIIKETLQND